MNKLSVITLQNTKHIADVREALARLETDILSEQGVGLSLPQFEHLVQTLGHTAREYQRLL